MLIAGDHVSGRDAANGVASWFVAAAAALSSGEPLPDPPTLVSGKDEPVDFRPLAFALEALRREQLNLRAQWAERKRAPGAVTF